MSGWGYRILDLDELLSKLMELLEERADGMDSLYLEGIGDVSLHALDCSSRALLTIGKKILTNAKGIAIMEGCENPGRDHVEQIAALVENGLWNLFNPRSTLSLVVKSLEQNPKRIKEK